MSFLFFNDDKQSTKSFTCDICGNDFSTEDVGAIMNTGGFDLNGTNYICPRCASRLTVRLTREINILKMENEMKNGKDHI